MSDEIQIELSSEVVGPGERLEGIVRWTLERAPSRARLRLTWHTEGEGERDGEVVGELSIDTLPRPPESGDAHPYRDTAVMDDGAPPLRSEDARIFGITMPRGPCSFRGQLFTIRWRLEAHIGQTWSGVELVLSPYDHELRT